MSEEEKAGFLIKNSSWDAVFQLHIQALEGKGTLLSKLIKCFFILLNLPLSAQINTIYNVAP